MPSLYIMKLIIIIITIKKRQILFVYQMPGFLFSFVCFLSTIFFSRVLWVQIIIELCAPAILNLRFRPVGFASNNLRLDELFSSRLEGLEARTDYHAQTSITQQSECPHTNTHTHTRVQERRRRIKKPGSAPKLPNVITPNVRRLRGLGSFRRTARLLLLLLLLYIHNGKWRWRFGKIYKLLFR